MLVIHRLGNYYILFYLENKLTVLRYHNLTWEFTSNKRQST